MKTNVLTRLTLSAGAGALICTAAFVFANDAEGERRGEQQFESSAQYEIQQEQQVQREGALIEEPAGAERPGQFQGQAQYSRPGMASKIQQASDLIGMNIENQDGQNLGEIDDLLIDLHSGKIHFAVLSSGGFLGIGERLIAVPLQAFTPAGDQQLVLNVDRETLRNAPTFTQRTWPESANANYLREANNYWRSARLPGVEFREPAGVELETEFDGSSTRMEFEEPSASLEVHEPAGAELSREQHYQWESRTPGALTEDEIDADGDRVLHLYQRGKQSADFTDRALKERGYEIVYPEGDAKVSGYYSEREFRTPGARTDLMMREPAGAERRTETFRTRDTQRGRQLQPQAATGKLSRASELIGMNLQTREGQNLGEIEDIVVDVSSGRVAYAVVSTGAGARLHAVPPAMFMQGQQENVVIFQGDSQKLTSAPVFERDRWNEATKRTYIQRVYRHYGVQPYWQAGGEFTEPAGTQFQDQQRFQQQQGAEWQYEQQQRDSFRQQQQQQQRGQFQQQPRAEWQQYDQQQHRSSIQQEQFREPAGTEFRTQQQQRGQFQQQQPRAEWQRQQPQQQQQGAQFGRQSQMQQSGQWVRGSDFIGMSVKDQQGKNIGTIDDVVIDLQTGQVAYTVLEAGGTLGIGDELYAVPPAALSIGKEEKTLTLKANQQTLQSAPKFDESNWQQATQQSYIQQVYRHYGVQPYRQAGRQFNEPAGAELEMKDWEHHERKSLDQKKGAELLTEPSGAQTQSRSSELQFEAEPERSFEIEEPSGTELKSEESELELQDKPDAELEVKESEQTQISEPAGLERQELSVQEQEKSEQVEVHEPSGAAGGQQLADQVRKELKNDPSLANVADQIQISHSDGKLVLRGTVSSEQQKQQIEEKVQEFVIDNQLQVRGQ